MERGGPGLEIVGHHLLSGDPVVRAGDALLLVRRDAEGGTWPRVGPVPTDRGPVYLSPVYAGLTVDEVAEAGELPEARVVAWTRALAHEIAALPAGVGVDPSTLVVDPSGRPVVDQVAPAGPDRGLAQVARYLLRGPLAHAASPGEPDWLVAMEGATSWAEVERALGLPAPWAPPAAPGAVHDGVAAGWLVLGGERPPAEPSLPPRVTNARFATLTLVLGLAAGAWLAGGVVAQVATLDAPGGRLHVLCPGVLEVRGAPPVALRPPGRCTVSLPGPGGDVVGEVDIRAAGRYFCDVVEGRVSCAPR